MGDILQKFMKCDYENFINKQMLYNSYILPIDSILEYIYSINKIPIESIIDYLQKYSLDYYLIATRDIFQFSNFEDCTDNICKILLSISNPGVSFVEAGELLLNDGKIRKNGALMKYGENHLKTSESLSLTWNLTNVFFLTCIGFVFPKLDCETKQKLLTRLIIRNKFISHLILALQKRKVGLRQYLYMISDSTYKRRISNIKTVIKVLLNSDEYNFNSIFNNLYY